MMSFSGGGVEGTTLKWSFCVGITTIPEPVRGGKMGLVPILYVEGKLVYRFSTVKTWESELCSNVSNPDSSPMAEFQYQDLLDIVFGLFV